ncbi:hypothetical protein XENORESO_005554 [Xenotaenia resolanae]|uniref:Uncharacterized protein n=1 Tax=Xenotaenia resolanae TaxID=208358 RepID=A0ABV0X1H5_9TELE
MSVTMAKSDAITVFTIQSDPQSRWPPVCQILKNLCYNPMCCSVSQDLRKIQRKSHSVLGAMQIMIGLLIIGFGAILRASTSTDWRLNKTEFPFWLGALFITFGVMNVLSEMFPSPCLVILNVILNLAGVAFAITAIVFYSIYISHLRLWRDCYFSRSYNKFYYITAPPSDLESEFFRLVCLEGNYVFKVILIGLNVLLIILSILELCVVITSVLIGIKALKNSGKEENRSTNDPEYNKPLLGEVAIHPTA